MYCDSVYRVSLLIRVLGVLYTSFARKRAVLRLNNMFKKRSTEECELLTHVRVGARLVRVSVFGGAKKRKCRLVCAHTVTARNIS